jgi:hypothetical protein
MTDLSEIFAEQQSNLIYWNGKPLYGLLEFDQLPSRIRLTFVSAKESPVQGVQFRIRGGTLLANGKESADIVLWQDTAPRNISIDVRRSGRGTASLKVWNVWRGGLGVTQAWLGNAAIQVEGQPNSGSFRMLCSDGQGEPSFDDLIVDVQAD